MRWRLEAISPRALPIIAVAVVLVYAAAVWFLLVSPKRSDASTARAELAAAELRLAEAQASSDRPRGSGAPVADVFRLAKAMPASTDQPGLVLELARLAKASGVTLSTITPQIPVAGVGGPTLIPLSVTVTGHYRKISEFLRRARALVTVRDGTIHATGRLLTVQSLELGESVTKRFPQLDATIALNAYVYDGPIVPLEPAEEPEEELTPSGSEAAGSTSR